MELVMRLMSLVLFVAVTAPVLSQCSTLAVTGSINAGQTITVDVNDIIKRGQRDKAVLLKENDVVMVPESFF